MAFGRILQKRNSPEFCVMGRAIKMRWATLFKLSCKIVIECTVDTTIINTTVMLKYIPLQHGADAGCMPEEALGDIACANLAMHGVNYHCTGYKHEHEQLTE